MQPDEFYVNELNECSICNVIDRVSTDRTALYVDVHRAAPFDQYICIADIEGIATILYKSTGKHVERGTRYILFRCKDKWRLCNTCKEN